MELFEFLDGILFWKVRFRMRRQNEAAGRRTLRVVEEGQQAR